MDNREETRHEDVKRKNASTAPESQCLNPLDYPTRQDSMEHGAKERSHFVTDPEYPGREIILEIARKLLDSFQQT
jgi:hypothetical protein